jgi:two-component system, NarL family, sensor kinase
MKKVWLLLLFLALGGITHGQNLMSKDSLLRLLPNAKKDTSTVLLYLNIGQQFEDSEPEIAKKYYRKARDLSKEIHYPKGIINYISNYTYVLNMQSLKDSSLILNLQAVALSKKINDSLNLAKTLFNTGTSYSMLGDYENAISYYIQGKKIFAKIGNEETEYKADDLLQLLYYNMRQYKKGIEHGERAVKGFKKLNNLPWLISSLNNLGTNYCSIRQLDKAEALFKEALDLGIKINSKNAIAVQNLNLGDIYIQKGEYEKIKPFMEKALMHAKELELYETEVIALKGLAFYYLNEKDYPTAEKYAHEALVLANKYKLNVERVKIYTLLSNLSFTVQNTKEGNLYATKSTLLNDSILNESIQKNTLLLEKKYAFEEKNAKIKLQDLKLQRRNTLNYILIGSTIITLLVMFLLYKNYSHKQKMQQHRINELEKEKQLTATEAVLKGEERERIRLAKDLHDGLGGMLSGIKFSFQSMKQNLIMTPDNQQSFERSMDMLDSSIREMRRVAHNMMPESLVKFGLDTAIKDFCNEINTSGALNLKYQSIGINTVKIDQTTSITIYRVVQELTNNIIKHAQANLAIVQVTLTDSVLTLTVEDDGKGFNPEKIRNSKGMGWENIKNRIDFLGGKVNIDSEEGKGTSVLIEINL